jgi:hypothetical protein
LLIQFYFSVDSYDDAPEIKVLPQQTINKNYNCNSGQSQRPVNSRQSEEFNFVDIAENFVSEFAYIHTTHALSQKG